MSWTQADRRRHDGIATRFIVDTLPILIAVVLATVLLCALEERFGIPPPDWPTIAMM